MPLGPLPRASVLRGVAVVVITGTITLAAACSDEDVVDIIPPPRPNPTQIAEEPTADFPTSPGTTSATTAP
jgi:hypothetical protein